MNDLTVSSYDILHAQNTPKLTLPHAHLESAIMTVERKNNIQPYLQGTVRVYQDLRVTLNPLVKLLISRRCIVDMDIMRNHEARLSLPRDDQIPKIPVNTS
jgi:hypothetical protein